MLSNAYFLAKFRFDTAENEPAKNLQKFVNFPNFPNFGSARRGHLPAVAVLDEQLPAVQDGLQPAQVQGPIDRFQRDKSDPSVIVFSEIKRCQLPHSTQFFQKAKIEVLQAARSSGRSRPSMRR